MFEDYQYALRRSGSDSELLTVKEITVLNCTEVIVSERTIALVLCIISISFRLVNSTASLDHEASNLAERYSEDQCNLRFARPLRFLPRRPKIGRSAGFDSSNSICTVPGIRM